MCCRIVSLNSHRRCRVVRCRIVSWFCQQHHDSMRMETRQKRGIVKEVGVALGVTATAKHCRLPAKVVGDLVLVEYEA